MRPLTNELRIFQSLTGLASVRFGAQIVCDYAVENSALSLSLSESTVFCQEHRRKRK